MSEQQLQFGQLYLVPTPIGNLEDMTFRAVRILQEVDMIAAEDTRNTQKLLNHFEIQTKQLSFHEHNTQERLPQLLTLLKSGQNLAQVSDAGMPSISDPGKELVKACIEAGIRVTPLPGPNAALTALIASGLTPQPFYFWGFLPRKPKEQKAVLTQLSLYPTTLMFYESPFRVVKTLEVMQTILGDRDVVLARELTKRYEEFIRGSISSVLAKLALRDIKGEFVILVAGADLENKAKATYTEAEIRAQVAEMIETGIKPNAAIKAVAQQVSQPKQAVYKIYHQL